MTWITLASITFVAAVGFTILGMAIGTGAERVMPRGRSIDHKHT
jgi:hypothetical protein